MLQTFALLLIAAFAASMLVEACKILCTWVLLILLLVVKDATFLFATYDCWTGWFWDGKKGRLYVFPLPMLGFYFDFKDHSYVM